MDGGPEPPYHYRWACPTHSFTAGAETCAFCLCYLCKTDFGKHGCCAPPHRWAAPGALDLWKPLFATQQPLPLQQADTPCVCWRKVAIQVPRVPGPQCANVPDAVVRRYLQQAECDGSVCHLLKPDFFTPATQPYLRLVMALCPEGRITKAMVGNMHRPPSPLAAAQGWPPVHATVQISNHQTALVLVVQLWIASHAPFLLRLDEGTTSVLKPRGGIVASSSSCSSPLDAFVQQQQQQQQQQLMVPFQTSLLKKMMAHESVPLHQRLWHALDDNVYVSKVGDWLSQGLPDGIDGMGGQGGILCMPSCSGKTRVASALVALTPEIKTLIVVSDSDMFAHWASELALFGVNPTWVTDSSSSGGTVARVTLVTWATLLSMPWLHMPDRVIYDDCDRLLTTNVRAAAAAVAAAAGKIAATAASYCQSNVSPVRARIVWALVDKMYEEKHRRSAWLRFLYGSSVPVDDTGLMSMVCHKQSQMSKSDNVAFTQLWSALVLEERVPTHMLPVVVKSDVVLKAHSSWLAQYATCWTLLQQNRAALTTRPGKQQLSKGVRNRFLGALAGDTAFTLTESGGAAGSRHCVLPLDVDECAVCHAGFVNPVRTPCKHYFCNLCLLTWLQSETCDQLQATTCPLCRQPIDVDSPDQIVRCAPRNLSLASNSAKVPAIVTACQPYLHHAGGRLVPSRLLVLSRFASVRKQLVAAFAQQTGVHAVDSVADFALLPEVRVLVTSPQHVEGKLLLNCNISVVVFAEPAVEDAAQDQVCKRLMRLGQTTQLLALTMVTEHTYEQVMSARSENERCELS